MDIRVFFCSFVRFRRMDISLVGPGNFIEVQKILPLLIEASPDHPSFDVVTLGLPGFGFSEALKKKGFTLDQYAEVGSHSIL